MESKESTKIEPKWIEVEAISNGYWKGLKMQGEKFWVPENLNSPWMKPVPIAKVASKSPAGK